MSASPGPDAGHAAPPTAGDGAQPALDQPALDQPAPEADGGWHRMHPVTPLVKGWKIIAVMLVLYAQQRGDDLVGGGAELPGRTEVLISLGLLAAGAVAAAGYSMLAWRMTRYQVGEEAVHLHSGVLSRTQRQARLDRLQAVDVVQPLLARLLGLTELRLEVAGGAGSDVKLAYLPEAEAHRLRNTLLARAAGVRYAEGEDAPEAPESEVLTVPVDRLVTSLLLSGTAVAMAGFLVVLVVAVVGFGEPGVLVGIGPALLGFVGASWARFNRGFSFRVATSADGVRLRHGLLESRAQTVPPGRVQAVRLSQPLLWRRVDWWRVDINVAGYSPGGDQGQSDQNVLLPVGTRHQAVLVLSLVLPDLGTDDDPWQVVAAGLGGATGDDDAHGFVGAPRRSRWLDPVGWRRNGFRVTDRALLCRRGRLWRQLDVVPHERTQSLGLTQGPVQRRLGVAAVLAHSTPGPVSPRVHHLDAAVAAQLLDDQAARAHSARAHAEPEQWMQPGRAGPQGHPAAGGQPRQPGGQPLPS